MLANNDERARLNMIVQQVRPAEVIDERVLDTMSRVPREDFVPEAYRGLAFADVIIPLVDGQCMMKPLQEARMLQALAVEPDNRVLEIGTGSGFVTACLVHLGGKVSSYEIRAGLAAAARERLAAEDVAAEITAGDALLAELPAQAFDVIAVTGSLPVYDDRLDDLLAPGGRMFVVVGEAPVMEATLVTRDALGNIHREGLYETSVPPLDGARQAEHFSF